MNSQHSVVHSLELIDDISFDTLQVTIHLQVLHSYDSPPAFKQSGRDLAACRSLLQVALN